MFWRGQWEAGARFLSISDRVEMNELPPLSLRLCRAYPDRAVGSPTLSVLAEASEGSQGAAAPPPKKRRTDTADAPFALPMDPARPITRAQSRRVTPLLKQANAVAEASVTAAVSIAIGCAAAQKADFTKGCEKKL